MSLNTTLMSRALFDEYVRNAERAGKYAREVFRNAYGRKKGDEMFDSICEHITRPGRGTPRLLIIED